MYDYSQSPIRILDSNIKNKLKNINPVSDVCFNEHHVQLDMSQETDPNEDIGPHKKGHLVRCSAQFLDFMWCSCFYWLVSQEETQSTLLRNPNATFLTFQNKDLCDYYDQIFQNMDLIITGNDSNIWPSGMYSPAYLPANTPPEIKDYILKANSLYTTAIVFILSHEIGHFVLGHQGYTTDQEYNIDIERDADQFALNHVYSDNPQGVDLLNRTFGCILGLLSCLHLYGTPGHVRPCILDPYHPSLQSRLEAIIQCAIPSSGRVINDISTDKEYFYHMISQAIGFYLHKYCNVSLPSYDAGNSCEQYFKNLLPFIDQYIHS